MSQAPAYTRTTEFSDDERDNIGGRSTVLTADLDAELDAIAESLNPTIENLALLQRDDGVMRDGAVPVSALGADTLKLLTATGVPRGAWATATAYAIKDLVTQSSNTYICVVAHTSGVFATDLASIKWILFQIGANPSAVAIPFSPTTNVTSTNLQAAIIEVDSNARTRDMQAASDLADTTTATKNAGSIGFNYSLSYAAGTIGRWLTDLSASTGPGFIGWLRAATSSVATTLQKWLGWQELNAFEFMTVAQIADFQAGTMTLDLAVPLQAWVTACAAGGFTGRIGKGTVRCGTTLSVPAGTVLKGHSNLSRLAFWGVDGLNINGDQVTVADMAMFGYTSGGVADPKTFNGIKINGTNGAPINNVDLDHLYMQGFAAPILANYSKQCTFTRIRTYNSANDIRLVGLWTNVSIDNCMLNTTSGNASISTVKSGSDQGEGLMVTNTLCYGGQYGFQSDGALSVGFRNCIVDAIQNYGFDCTNVQNLDIDIPWCYSVNRGVYLRALGSLTDVDTSIKIGLMTVTGADSAFVVGANNRNWSLLAGSTIIKSNSSGYPIFTQGPKGRIGAIKIRQVGTNADIYVDAADIRIADGIDLTNTIQYNTSQARSVASAANLALPTPYKSIEYITVTGTTTVTSMTDAPSWSGRIVVLYFSGALTMTDTSNIKLNSNFVTTADDTLTLFSDGTSFIEIARSAN